MIRSVISRLAFVLCIVPMVFACQSSYKVSRDSYVFKTETHKPATDQEDQKALSPTTETASDEEPAELRAKELTVSTATEPAVESVDEKVNRTKDAPEFVKEIADGSKSREEAVEEYKSLSKKEKRQVKKWAKKEDRAYKKEMREAKKADAVTRDMRTGIILGAAGLVLLLIAGSGVLGAIGAILFVVGLVFILLEVL